MTLWPSIPADSRRALTGTVERNAARYIADLQELIAIGRGGEPAVQASIERRLRALDGDVEAFAYDPQSISVPYEFITPDAVIAGRRTAVVGIWPGAGTGKTLLLFAHPDCEPLREPERWSGPPFEPRREGNRLVGWGVADDLAGLAAMVCAWDAVRRAPVERRGGLILASAPSKGHARGIVPVLERIPAADGALYLHPAESGAGLAQIKTGTLGTLHCRIRIAGRPPVTFEPDQIPFAFDGINPIDLAVDLAWVLRRLMGEGGPAGATMCITYLAAGRRDRLHRLPLAAELGVAAAFPGAVAPECVRGMMAEAIDCWRRQAWPVGPAPAVEWLSGTAGAQVRHDDGLVRLATDEIAAVTGRWPVPYDRHPSSDIRHPILGRGIPTVGLGPRAGDLVQSGGVDEWVDLDEYVLTIKAVAAVIARWCGSTPQDATAASRAGTSRTRQRRAQR